MSFPPKGKALPKTGKELHRRSRSRLHVSDYETAIAQALKAELRSSKSAVKTVMKWTGASERAVKGWFAGSSGPSSKHLISLARNSDCVFMRLLMLSGRTLAVPEPELSSLRDLLAKALQAIDYFTGGRTA